MPQDRRASGIESGRVLALGGGGVPGRRTGFRHVARRPEEQDRRLAVGTILIVDDDPTYRELFRDILQSEGHTAVTAENGARAIELASSATPDLILMDVQMAQMGGIEALVALRQNPVTSAIRVIAVTALAMEGDEERLLAAGFDDYISKPVDLDAIRAVVRCHAPLARDGKTSP
ncbi:MAG: hypothetical protein C0418_00465 [Coriobacteriaceae bacterium]|nr:hypothetical protein [Coriobacteriaceae bacterium]